MYRIIVIISVLGCIVTGLTVGAVRENAKRVVTVDQLLEEAEVASERPRIRLGARVTDGGVQVHSEDDEYFVTFSVQDPKREGESSGAASLPVKYNGAMPDTLKAGRDVIIEGDFINGTLQASSLQTQCPSKYEPPVPD